MKFLTLTIIASVSLGMTNLSLAENSTITKKDITSESEAPQGKGKGKTEKVSYKNLHSKKIRNNNLPLAKKGQTSSKKTTQKLATDLRNQNKANETKSIKDSGKSKKNGELKRLQNEIKKIKSELTSQKKLSKSYLQKIQNLKTQRDTLNENLTNSGIGFFGLVFSAVTILGGVVLVARYYHLKSKSMMATVYRKLKSNSIEQSEILEKVSETMSNMAGAIHPSDIKIPHKENILSETKDNRPI